MGARQRRLPGGGACFWVAHQNGEVFNPTISGTKSNDARFRRIFQRHAGFRHALQAGSGADRVAQDILGRHTQQRKPLSHTRSSGGGDQRGQKPAKLRQGKGRAGKWGRGNLLHLIRQQAFGRGVSEAAQSGRVQRRSRQAQRHHGLILGLGHGPAQQGCRARRGKQQHWRRQAA